MSHTPRPWHIMVAPVAAGVQGLGIYGADGTAVAAVYHPFKDREADNAKLIHATPDLFEACEEAIDIIIWMSGASAFGPDGEAHAGWCGAQERIKCIRAAIAKARREVGE